MLTKQQLRCYNVMKEYKEKNGIIPSYDEITCMMGLKSKGNVHRFIVALEERGAIKRMHNRARSIRLLDLQ